MDIHKGTMRFLKKDNDETEMWYISFDNAEESLPLHPSDAEYIKEAGKIFDNIEARILNNPHVEFFIISAITQEKYSGVSRLTHFAKLTNEYKVYDLPEQEKTWNAKELYEMLEVYRVYAYSNGLTTSKLVDWFTETIGNIDMDED